MEVQVLSFALIERSRTVTNPSWTTKST